MPANAQELFVTLHQLASLTDMLEAAYRDASERNNYALLPLTSEGFVQKIRELNTDIRAYLQAHDGETEPMSAPDPVA